LFSIGSNSKLFTAIAVGIALEDRRSANVGSTIPNWNTKVKDLVPGWGLLDPIATEQADVMDLLSMNRRSASQTAILTVLLPTAHQTGLPLHTHFEE
jgi:hypothetical protein